MMDKEYKTRKPSKRKRAKMPMDQRAKIFLSFKALKDDTDEDGPLSNKKKMDNENGIK